MAENSQTPRGVIWDWGGVITGPIKETVADWMRREGIDRASYAAAFRPWFADAYGVDGRENPIHALERGELADAEFEELFASLLMTESGDPVRGPGLLRRMSAAEALVDEMVRLVGELRTGGIRTALLSNSWGVRDDAYPWQLLEDLFDTVVISGQVGMRKPEQRIFLLAAARLGLAPHECVFVDDIEANVIAAQALGFATVLHSDPVTTRAEVTRLVAGRPVEPGAAALA